MVRCWYSMNSILHVDMDAFYASVEQRDQPEYLGKPVVVGGPPESRGVVAACSYEARKYGIHSAMPSAEAVRRCKEVVFLPVRHDRYQEVSTEVMEIIESFTPVVQKLSIDEAFMDVSGTRYLYVDSVALARELKRTIREKLRLNASVGVARNKFLAKLASDLDKPNGLTIVPEPDAELLQFLAPLEIKRIWGVGKVLEARLVNAGIRTFSDVHKLTRSAVLRIPGNSMGEMLWNLAHGIDDREVETERIEKSISSETTFAKDLTDRTQLRSFMVGQAEEVGRRLRASAKYAGTVQIKIRYADFKTITRQVTASPAIHSDADIIRLAKRLLAKVKLKDGVRLSGVGVANLKDQPGNTSDDQQMSLFAEESGPPRKSTEQLDQAVDQLRDKYGNQVLKRGTWSDS